MYGEGRIGGRHDGGMRAGMQAAREVLRVGIPAETGGDAGGGVRDGAGDQRTPGRTRHLIQLDVACHARFPHHHYCARAIHDAGSQHKPDAHDDHAVEHERHPKPRQNSES